MITKQEEKKRLIPATTENNINSHTPSLHPHAHITYESPP